MLVGVIITCEVFFWVFLLSGLAARYLLKRPTLGAVLLVCAPMVDLILLAASIIDLRGGGTATGAHSLAAVYLGVSVGFGHGLIRRADVRFAHRFAGGPAPAPKAKYGHAHAAREPRAWLHHLVAWAVGVALMLLAVVTIGDAPRTEQFLGTAKLWTLILVIDGIISLSYTINPKKAPAGVTETGQQVQQPQDSVR